MIYLSDYVKFNCEKCYFLIWYILARNRNRVLAQKWRKIACGVK